MLRSGSSNADNLAKPAPESKLPFAAAAAGHAFIGPPTRDCRKADSRVLWNARIGE